MDTIDTCPWTDADIADLVADTMSDHHHDMDVSFADHARHIVAALRDARLLGHAPLDVDGVRDEIERISELAAAAFGKRFQFCTVTIWGPQYRGRSATVEVRLHIQGDPKGSFSAASAAEAIADAERFIREHNPAAAEAAGWAILGVVRA